MFKSMGRKHQKQNIEIMVTGVTLMHVRNKDS